MKSPWRITLLGLVLLISGVAEHSVAKPTKRDSAARDQRMEWWRDARLGMFIHWGLYAIPAGEWNGKEVPGIGEWIMNQADIPVADYALLANQFNPVKYDPAEWVDWWTEEDGQDLVAYLRKLKPSLIINNRVSKGRKGMQGLNKGDRQYSGDFGTPEQEIPETGVSGVDWESCITMNDTWGYKKGDHNWKSVKQLLHNIIDIASKGGNLLLNVGPTAAGEIPAASVQRLAAMGQWMKKNGEAIYGTSASPVEAPAWGRYTTKQIAEKRVLYAHLLDWPSNATITVPWNNDSTPLCRLLASGEPLTSNRSQDTIAITLPSVPPDTVATTSLIVLAEE